MKIFSCDMSVQPYQFEPTKKNLSKSSDEQHSSDDGWEDVSDNDAGSVDNETLENKMATLNRVEVSVEVWCKCSLCQTMPVNRECLCCHEIDEIRLTKLNGMFC